MKRTGWFLVVIGYTFYYTQKTLICAGDVCFVSSRYWKPKNQANTTGIWLIRSMDGEIRSLILNARSSLYANERESVCRMVDKSSLKLKRNVWLWEDVLNIGRDMNIRQRRKYLCWQDTLRCTDNLCDVTFLHSVVNNNWLQRCLDYRLESSASIWGCWNHSVLLLLPKLRK